MDKGSASNDILGVGWNFPVRVDRRREDEVAAPDRGHGGIAFARREDDIAQGIRIILATGKGERRMRPSFGSELNTLIFAPANPTTFGLMRHYVEQALAMWEPRIQVGDVEVDGGDADGKVDIHIAYEVLATKDNRTLVYPFYTMGEE